MLNLRETEADTLQQNQKYAESIAVVEQKLASMDRLAAVKEIGLRLDKLQDKDQELTQHAEATDNSCATLTLP